MKKKKLLILIWDMGSGGIQKRVKDIIKAIDKDHPEWQIYLSIKGKEDSFFDTDLKKRTKVIIRYCQFCRGRLTPLKTTLWITKEYATINPNTALTFLDHLSISLIILSKLFFWRKTKIVLNEGVFTSKYLKLNRSWYWKRLVKGFYKYADKIIVPTYAVKKDLISNFSVSPKIVKVVSNWTLYRPTKPLVKKYDLIYIGRFEHEKNPLGFVDLVKNLKPIFPKIRTIMLGTGRLHRQITNQVNRHKLKQNIALPGSVSNPHHYLRQSKILILTTYNEGMPNVVLEAAMCQVPSVVSNFVGVDEVIINRKTGYITTSENEMVSKVNHLLKHPGLISKLGTQAQKHVERNFSIGQQKKFVHELLA